MISNYFNKKLYRITHIDNLEHIVKLGKITSPNNEMRDPEYIGIGDNSLIDHRSHRQVPLPPHGTFRDYISFYFCNRSPMLFVIQKGFNEVKKRAPEEIIYLVTNYSRIKNSGKPFMFFDGHAIESISSCYNDDSGLEEIDWNIIDDQYWKETEEDPDRKRRKQAELLVYNELSLNDLLGIAAYNQEALEKIQNIFLKNDVNLHSNIRKDWYY